MCALLKVVVVDTRAEEQRCPVCLSRHEQSRKKLFVHHTVCFNLVSCSVCSSFESKRDVLVKARKFISDECANY